MKFNKKLIILVGNIGSGKSTITKTYVDKGYIVIARDALRYNIGAGKYIFDPELEPAIWNSELDMLKHFMRTKANIIVDEVSLNAIMRSRYILAASVFNYKTTALVMPVLSMKESVDRRMKDPHGQPNRTLWETVWKKFDSIYEIPLDVEGFAKIINYKEENNGND